jgi:hypothetical protein
MTGVEQRTQDDRAYYAEEPKPGVTQESDESAKQPQEYPELPFEIPRD